MKNVIVILSAAVLFAGGCGRKPDKQAAPETGNAESLIRNDSDVAYQAEKTERPETESAGKSGEAKPDTQFVSQFSWHVDIKTDVQILYKSSFRDKPADFEHMLSEEWYDFYQDETTKNYFLKKAVIRIKNDIYDDCWGDTTIYVGSERGMILIKGIIPQNENIASVPITKDHILVGEKYEFSFNEKTYVFRCDGVILASGITIDTRWEEVENYKLYFSEQGKEEQLIVAFPIFGIADGSLQLLWIGDIDEDGKPDFILKASTYLDHTVTLFLSSKAGDGEVVKAVASWYNDFSC